MTAPNHADIPTERLFTRAPLHPLDSATVPDRHMWSRSRLKLNLHQTGGQGDNESRTVKSGDCRQYTPNLSVFCGLSAELIAGPSKDSYKALVLQFFNSILLKSHFQQWISNVSNSSGQACQVQGRFGTDPLPNPPSWWSEHPDSQFGFGLIDCPKLAKIGRVGSALSSGSSCTFI